MQAYLDNSATTRPCPEAVAAITACLTENWGNPSSIHRLGDRAAKTLEDSRKAVAAAMGAEPDRVFFTSGGTEADNWAIFSTARARGKRGKHIITTAVEHHAILEPMARLEADGFEVTYLRPDDDGRVSLASLREALRKDTILVSVMMVNNETGAVMPIAQMAKLTHRMAPDALFHTDAVQGFLKVPFQAKSLGADLISVSGHKVHGPKGVGALYIRQGLHLPPFLLGGGQEKKQRSGTEPLPLIAGFGAACAAGAVTFRDDIARMAGLRDYLRAELAKLPFVTLVAPGDAPHIVNLAVPAVRSQELINRLQDREVYVSAGSACAKGHRSHVLEALNLDPAVIDGSIRVSLSKYTTEEEIAQFLSVLTEAFG
jgi:cysteine desulfurase